MLITFSEPGPPAKFGVRARGPTYFQLDWAPPKENNGFLIGYNISYQLGEWVLFFLLQFRKR
jgi:hypothetical protein